MRAATVAGLLAVLAAGVGAVSPPASSARVSASTVRVVETEWKITPSPRTVKAGTVTFLVHNTGKVAHEFIVVRTNRPANALRISAGKAVVRGMVAKLASFKPGGWRGLRVTLRAGRYVLLCNLPRHYRAGMHASFRVI
jgi:uncharacterized cupredoxin-like copper-binding protein